MPMAKIFIPCVWCANTLTFGAVVRILYSTAKGKKKRPSDDGRFSLYIGYEKDIFRNLPLGFELKRLVVIMLRSIHFGSRKLYFKGKFLRE